MPRIAPLIIATVLTMGLAVCRPEACVCVGTYSGQPACQARWQYTEIFVGRVPSVVPARSEARRYVTGGATTQFAVIESFVGVQSRTYQLADSGTD
jgi:hypothetical protein